MRTTKISHPQPAPACGKNYARGMTLIELLVVIVLVVILWGIAMPNPSGLQTKGAEAKDLSNARQVGLGLRLYASDHNGKFPTSTKSANEAFRYIVPTYIPSQKIFYLPGSGWSTGSHPVEVSSSGTLAAGQNTYAYVSGLLDSDDTNYPLVADGFNAGAPGVYNSVQGTKGGVWKGKHAVVVRVDDSAAIEAVAGSDFRVYANGMNPARADIFTTSAKWMPSGVVLNPE